MKVTITTDWPDGRSDLCEWVAPTLPRSLNLTLRQLVESGATVAVIKPDGSFKTYRKSS